MIFMPYSYANCLHHEGSYKCILMKSKKREVLSMKVHMKRNVDFRSVVAIETASSRVGSFVALNKNFSRARRPARNRS